MTTPLFLLRCLQVGLSLRDLDLLTVGMVNDIFAEQLNDDCKYATLATQEDFDRFLMGGDGLWVQDGSRASRWRSAAIPQS